MKTVVRIEPEFLTVDQVAATLQLSRPSVYKLFANRKLTAIKFGAATRVRRSEVNEIK